MKKFETPVIEISKFSIADVLTTSNDENPNCPNETDERG